MLPSPNNVGTPLSNPTKATTYPDLLPSEAPHFLPVGQYEILRRFLKQGSAWIYVDGQDVMSRCQPYQQFYRLDFHITAPAAYCFAKEIVSRIAIAEGKPATYWNPKFTYSRSGGHGGGIGSFMALLYDLTEEYDDDNDRVYFGRPTAEGSFIEDADRFFEWIYRTEPRFRVEKLPPMVLYGNSFVDLYLDAGFQFQFQDVYRVRSNGIAVEEMLRKLPPNARYVVVQFIEPYLSEFLRYTIPTD
jgi:hypothetical protein